MIPSTHVAAAAIVLLLAQDGAPPKAEPEAVSIEAEVLANVKAQPIGPATVEDLDLPAPFLRRVARRVIRSSFEERYRIVLPDAPPDAATPESARPENAPPRPESAPRVPAKSGGVSIGLIAGTLALVGLLLVVVFGRKSGEAPR